MSAHQSEEMVFAAAARLADDERAAYLDRVCAGDTELRQRLEARLAAHAQAPDRLKETEAQPASPNPTIKLEFEAESEVSERIGRYKLLQKIGEGGCGVVYMAEQEEPVRRRVALKVIKPGMDTKQVLARFEAERQALALMDHPNIAKVFDGGATGNGRPFFVMEMVKGIRITDYCDENKLSTQDRLALFSQVCQAIQHAHQKGIIHRDIKPSNILVADHDGVPVPKVIDFGIAKATTDQRLTDKTLFTALEQFIGTPAYMSPEQARMSGLDIDTRSDIYSLGVLLYELLTGKTPFDAKRLLEAGFDEIRRIIREEEPPRPSTRLSTLGATEQTILANQRHSEPPKLLGIIRGDLDWIVMKALEKDRNRQYDTANGLAADVERHLKNEPVVACPPSNFYRFQKLVHRNQLTFAATGFVAVALLLGVGVSTWQAVRARRSEREQVRLRGEAEHAQRNAELMRKQAEAAGQSARYETKRAENAALETKAALANSDFLQAVRLIADDRSDEALAFLARSLSLNPTNTPAAIRLVTLLSSRSWAMPTVFLESSNFYQPAAFSPDGKRIVLGAQAGSTRVYDVHDGKLLSELGIHARSVDTIDFSPDGKRIVTGSADKSVRVWDAETGRALTDPMMHPYPVSLARFTSDGNRVFTAAGSNRLVLGAVQVWDAKTGRPLVESLKLGMRLPFIEFSPDGWTLVVADAKHTQVWDLLNGTIQNELPYHTLAAHLSSDEKRIAARGLTNGSVQILDALTSMQVAVLNGLQFVQQVQFSPNGKLILVIPRDRTARIFDANTGQAVTEALSIGNSIQTLNVCFSGDSRMALCSGLEKAHLLDTGTGRLVVEPWLEGGSTQWSPCFSSDGTLILERSPERAIVRKIKGNGSLPDVFRHNAPVISAHFSPDGERLVTVLSDNTIRLWNVRSGRQIMGSMKHDRQVNTVEFSPDGKNLLTASDDGTAVVWDTRTGLPSFPPLKHAGRVFTARFNSDGKRIVTAAEDKTACVWDAVSGVRVAEPFEHERRVVSARFNPAGTKIVTLLDNSTVRLWNLLTRQVKKESRPLFVTFGGTNSPFDIKKSAVIEPQFSPDGEQIFAGWRMSRAVLWETETNLVGKSYRYGGQSIRKASFSFDTRWIATLSQDLRVFDTRSGEPLTEPIDPGSSIISAEFSPDGAQILDVTSDGKARVWDVLSGQPLTDVMSAGGRVLAAQFSSNGKRIVTVSEDRCARIWELAPASTQSPGWLPKIAEALSGRRFNKSGILQQSKQNPVELLNHVRRELADLPKDDDWVVWGRWFLGDPAARSITPFSKITVTEYVEDRIKENTPISLNEAEQLAFGNPDVLRRISLARTTAEELKEANALRDQGEFTKAETIYRKLAQQGSVTAQLELGNKYGHGNGVIKDLAEAARWFRMAADQGEAYAQSWMGWIYETGQGAPKDTTEAIRWYRKAADGGNARAQSELGRLYDNGEGLPKDTIEAAKWYRMAADQGDAFAQRVVGWNYEIGKGKPKDMTEAAKWYRKAADGGNANAQSRLGKIYEYGDGLPKNIAEAINWYRKAAEQGDADAKNQLGRLSGEPAKADEGFKEKYTYERGYFGKHLESDKWKERAVDGVYNFEELKRDNKIIWLKDLSRNFIIQIPVEGGMSRLSTDAGNTWQNLYEVQKE